MTEYQVTLRKTKHNGWEARTEVPLGGAVSGGRTGERVLDLSTGKRNGVLTSTASAVLQTEDGCSVFGLFSDYSKRVIREKRTATEKAVREVHAAALALLPQIVEDAKAFYAAKAEEAARRAARPDAPFPGAKLVRKMRVEVFTDGLGQFVMDMAGMGFPVIDNHRSDKTRDELQGAPIFKGLIGPMWDGGVWRYEDQETSDILSR